MAKNQGDKCPICANRGVIMHTSALVRALGMRLGWGEAKKPLAVCVDCYDLLATYRQIVKAEIKPERPRAA